jgi:hypothetical protein
MQFCKLVQVVNEFFLYIWMQDNLNTSCKCRYDVHVSMNVRLVSSGSLSWACMLADMPITQQYYNFLENVLLGLTEDGRGCS